MSLRQRAGLTQVQLASALGLTDHTIRNWEKRRSVPSLTPAETLRLCEVLQCSLEELAEAFNLVETQSA